MTGLEYLLFVAGFLTLLCGYAFVSWVVDRIYGPEQ